MKKKKLKKFLGLAMASTMMANYTSYIAYALPISNGSATGYENIVNSLKDNYVFKPNDSSDTLKISSDIDTTSDEMVSVIVEFVSTPRLVDKATNGAKALSTNKVERDHKVFQDFLGKMSATMADEDSSINIKYEYKDIFNGMSLTMKASDIPKLINSDVVKRVYKNYEVTAELPTVEEKQSNTGGVETYMADSLPFLNVDKLHEEGTTGKGIKVGVLDTGIDYNHPDLTSVYKGFRNGQGDENSQDMNGTIGWDFVDNDADPMETTYADWKESTSPEVGSSGGTYYTSHGTHVSGTIAGTKENKESDYAVLGVAPDVELYGYRVLGPYGSGGTDGIIAGIEKSVQDGMDVINLSLGSTGGTVFDAMVEAVNNATLAGVVTVVAAGNAGPGASTLGSPGTAPLPITVGASTVENNIDLYDITVSGLDSVLKGKIITKDFKTQPEVSGDLELVYCGVGDEVDYEDKDVKGKIAVVDRGDLALIYKAEYAKKNGAILTILVNNDDSNPVPYVGEGDLNNMIAISKEQGDKLKELIASNEELRVNSEELTVESAEEVAAAVEAVEETVEAERGQSTKEIAETENGQTESNTVEAKVGQTTSDAVKTDDGQATSNAVENEQVTESTTEVVNNEESADNSQEVTEETTAKAKGLNVNVTKSGTETTEGDEVAEFSSAGPVRQTFDIRPDVVAPGVQILSTVPGYINDKQVDNNDYNLAYGRMSGTSMATPHVAGIAALILQANPDYTPEDVKAALMNTSEHLHDKNGANYSVHQIGAGRVNPYEAVHDKVSIKANYKVRAGVNQDELDNVTGMLSFGRITKDENGSVTKKIEVEIANNTESSKTYSLEVEYSDSDRSNSAADNGVKLDMPNQVSVDANSTKTFEVELTIPKTASMGTYEGYVHVKENGGENKDYQLPFSATCKGMGFESLDFPSNNGLYKGISAFNSSILYNRHSGTIFANTDIAITLSASDPVEYIHTFIKDVDTKEIIGYSGSEEGYWIPESTEVLIENINPNGKVSKIKNGKVLEEEMLLEDGIYELEVVLEMEDGQLFTDSLNIAIMNDARETSIETTNFKPGITEVTEDMYTEELWYDNMLHEGIWVKGKVENGVINTLKEQYGMDYLKQGQLNIVSAEYKSDSGMIANMGAMIEDDGTFKIAGVERTDLEKGYFKFSLTNINPGSSYTTPQTYIFVDPSKSYLSVDFDDKKATLDKQLNGVISINNVEDITEGSFKLYEYGDGKSEISIKPTKELQAYLDDNGNTVEFDITKAEDTFDVSFKVEKDSKDIVGINGDMPLFDITYSLTGFKGFDENIVNNNDLLYNTIQGITGEFKTSKNEVVDVIGETIEAKIALERNSTMVYGTVPLIAGSISNVEIYAVDEQGNKYEPTLRKHNSEGTKNHSFVFSDLPVIEGDYKIVSKIPGGFDEIIHVPGGQVNKDGKLVGVPINLTSYNMNVSSGLYNVVGDVNNDGTIDLLDAIEIGKLYNKDASENTNKNLYVDLSQNGKIDKDDMRLVLFNYLKQDFSRDDLSDPVEMLNGEDIIDILDKCGYYDEAYEQITVKVFSDKETSYIGESVDFTTATYSFGEEFDFTGEVVYSYYVKEESENSWTMLADYDFNPTFTWTPEKPGKYEFKVRTIDIMGGSSQHTINHTVLPISVEGITLNANEVTLKAGENYSLTTTVTPENATNKDVVWTSSNEEIATVENGVVTALKDGVVDITATTVDGNLTATCKVTVLKEEAIIIPIESLELDKDKLTLKEGEKQTLNATIKPENATNKNVVWASSNEEIATVENGVVTAIKKGEVEIKVTSVDGKFSDTCSVTVTGEEDVVIPVKSLKLDTNKVSLKEGENQVLKVTINPENATNTDLVWTSSDEEVATVKDGVVTAIKAGKAEIVVSTPDGKVKDKCKVTVSSKTLEVVKVKSVKLDKNNIKLETGKEHQLNAKINPEDADNKNVTWKSSNEKVATVINGKVVAVGEGTATITVTTVDGGYTDTCKVTVYKKGQLPQTGGYSAAALAMIGLLTVGAGAVTLRKRK